MAAVAGSVIVAGMLAGRGTSAGSFRLRPVVCQVVGSSYCFYYVLLHREFF